MTRRIVFFVLGISLALPMTGRAATQLGIRGGWANASGAVFEGSGDVGSSGIYGLVVSVGLFASIDVEFAYERYTSDFSFERAAFEDTFFAGEAEFEDQAYLFTGKLNLPLVGSPLGLYGGGGFSLHEIDLKVESSDESISDYLDEIGGDRSDWEWHLVAGAGMKIPVVPLRAYAEFRYQNVNGDDNPNYSSIYGGLNLYLQ